jgi:hypothetical protein
MLRLFRVSLRFNGVLKHRGGRFLTVYRRGERVNGKVIKVNPLFATVQRAQDGKVFTVKNWSIKFVCADHQIHTTSEAL